MLLRTYMLVDEVIWCGPGQTVLIDQKNSQVKNAYNIVLLLNLRVGLKSRLRCESSITLERVNTRLGICDTNRIVIGHKEHIWWLFLFQGLTVMEVCEYNLARILSVEINARWANITVRETKFVKILYTIDYLRD